MWERHRGFSLLELVLTIGITSVIAVTAVRMYLVIGQARAKAGALEEVQANARFALDVIGERIRAATSVNAGASTFGADPGVLTLRMADGAKDPTVFSLSADDGTLWIREGMSATGALTSSSVRVTNLVFRSAAPSGAPANIRVEMTMATAADVGPEYAFSESLQTAMSLRR